MGLDGAVYQMLDHGISTGALFAIVGLLYERRHSLAIEDYGGVATAAPWLSTAFLITTLASIGLPTLNNFVGEFLVLQGAALVNFTWTVFASLGVILSACYMLWMYQRVFYGEVNDEVPAPRARPQCPRMGGGDPADRDDGVDGRVLAELPAAGRQGQRAGARSRPQVNVPFRVQIPNRTGGRQCPLIRCRPGRPHPLPARDHSDHRGHAADGAGPDHAKRSRHRVRPPEHCRACSRRLAARSTLTRSRARRSAAC